MTGIARFWQQRKRPGSATLAGGHYSQHYLSEAESSALLVRVNTADPESGGPAHRLALLGGGIRYMPLPRVCAGHTHTWEGGLVVL
eukprot:6885808-Pyramimonas_sp.AAC.1